MEVFGNQSKDADLLSSVSSEVESLVKPDKSVPAEWMGKEVPYPFNSSVVDFIREKVRLQPNAPAVQDGPRVMSFGELDRKSDLVAEELLKRGLRLEEPVVTMTPLSCEYLAAIFGILKAGGCYFPIDIETPAKRLEFLLADCKTRFVLSDSVSMERLKNWPGSVINLMEVVNNNAGLSGKNIPSDPSRVAYLLYTSGSTGQPKGVQIEHRSLTNFVCFYHQRFNLSPKDRSSMLAYIAFDVSVSDIWPALCAGGTVVVPPKGILADPDGLINWLKAQEITLSFVPTGLVEILFTRPWPAQMKLRYLTTGGDRLRVRPPANLPFTVINGYGPTESTVFATMSVVKPEDGSGKPPPIGLPLDNVTAYVLDEERRLLPVETPGELYLGGLQLARGYLGRAELTHERFVPDPFHGEQGARMYRTGDWAQWLPDGELDFLGRRDDQIQIRGYRVELGEIEALLFAHEKVKQVCCVPSLVNGMPTSVVAHVVANNGYQDLSGELHAYLSEQLPEYMVPSKFILHERLPLTPQGKADRAAMIALTDSKERSPEVTVEGGLEHALAALWRSLLPAAVSSPSNSTFAELGGDSLLMVKLALSVREVTGQQLDALAVSMRSTFDDLCKAVKSQMAGTEFQPVLTLRKHGDRPPLFLLYGLSGDIEMYFNLVEALGNDQPVYGIRSPALKNLSHLPASIEAAAAEIVSSIRRIQPQGAPAVVGYCWSGKVAFEVSRQLARTDGVDCFTAAIATDAPLRPTTSAFRLIHLVRCLPSWVSGLVFDRVNRRQRIRHLWDLASKKKSLSENNLAPRGWDSSPITRHLLALAKQYCPLPRSNTSIELFRERDEYKPHGHPIRPGDTSYLPNGGWDHWTSGNVGVNWLDGDHHLILKPPLVENLAQAMRSAHDRYMQKMTSRGSVTVDAKVK